MTVTRAIAPRSVVVVAAIAALAGVYWVARVARPVAVRPPITVEVSTPALTRAEKDARYRYLVPVTKSQPSRGPVDALVTMVVWSELRGAAARAADGALQAVMQKYPSQLRWVHRHFFDVRQPEVHALHHVAQGVNHHAGKFWELRAALLALPDDKPLPLAEQEQVVEAIGVEWDPIGRDLARKGFANHVNADLAFAQKFGVTQTPGIFVNGRRLIVANATTLEDALDALVASELRAAESLVQRGVARAQVYKELTKDGLWNIDDDPIAQAARAQAQASAAPWEITSQPTSVPAEATR